MSHTHQKHRNAQTRAEESQATGMVLEGQLTRPGEFDTYLCPHGHRREASGVATGLRRQTREGKGSLSRSQCFGRACL